ncbi:LOW QUALITY PROTEIN: hypothetical protein CVT25_015661, partial [Psilocybe cyanescens]
MPPNKSLELLRAMLNNIEVDGDIEGQRVSRYSLKLNVDGRKLESTEAMLSASTLKWEWSAENEVTGINKRIGMLEERVVDFLDNGDFDLTDDNGVTVPDKMKVALSPTPKSDDYIAKFLDKVDADASILPQTEAILGTASTLVQVLKLTKAIMDQLSKAHPILSASWIAVSSVYQLIQETDIHDEFIQELAKTLCKMLATAAAVPDLPQIPKTDNVINEISRQSLRVASLIHKYTKLSFAKRTVKIQLNGIKSCILQCQRESAALKERLHNRIQFDIHAQTKQIGQKLDVIKDDALAAKISNWLSSPDTSKILNDTYEKCQDGTCVWFLEGEQFFKWQESSGFLWIKGKAGSGKSVLCSSVIKTLAKKEPHLVQEVVKVFYGKFALAVKDIIYAISRLTNCFCSSSVIKTLAKKEPHLVVAYFFFDGRDSQITSYGPSLYNFLIIMGGCLKTWKVYINTGDHQQPSVKDLENILQDILNVFSHIYIVIDVLDECTDYVKTLDWVAKFISNSTQLVENLHSLADQKKILKRNLINFDVADLSRQDILDYLEAQVDLNFQTYHKEIQKKIKTQLKKGAEGSFRWVALQLHELTKCQSEHEVIVQLNKLPKDLNTIYNQILMEIDKKYLAHTMTFLQWLAFSKHLMTIMELAETVTVDFDCQEGLVFDLTKRYNDPWGVLIRCSSL